MLTSRRAKGLVECREVADDQRQKGKAHSKFVTRKNFRLAGGGRFNRCAGSSFTTFQEAARSEAGAG
jgi:hypothetical protein